MPEVPASFLQSKICEVLDAWGSSSINSLETSIAFYRDSTGFVETHQTLGHQIALTKQQCFEEPETDGLNFPWNTIGFKNDWVKEYCQIHNFWKRIWDIFFPVYDCCWVCWSLRPDRGWCRTSPSLENSPVESDSMNKYLMPDEFTDITFQKGFCPHLIWDSEISR